MLRYTNISTGNTILVAGEIKGKNWVKTDEINDFKEQAAEIKEKAAAKKEKVKEETEKPVEAGVDIPDDLEEYTNADLSEILFEMGVEHNARLKKEDLIKLIEENR
ncbi:hypothetical protein [Anaerococcus nagyae]|uniref:hypothetical protein n=1 Tax=Anaerococcus nagyae TaxID=1755241 RepID=UPI003735F8F8